MPRQQEYNVLEKNNNSVKFCQTVIQVFSLCFGNESTDDHLYLGLTMQKCLQAVSVPTDCHNPIQQYICTLVRKSWWLCVIFACHKIIISLTGLFIFHIFFFLEHHKQDCKMIQCQQSAFKNPSLSYKIRDATRYLERKKTNKQASKQ